MERRCSEFQARVLAEIKAPAPEIDWCAETNDRYWEVDYEKRDW